MRNDGVIILTENKDIFDDNFFANKDFRKLYNKVESFIDIIFFTDRQTFSKEKHSIFFSFEFNAASENLEEDYSNINEFVHLFIDILCGKLRFNNSVIFLFIFFILFFYNYQQINQSIKLRGEYQKIKEKENLEKNNEEIRQKKYEKMEKMQQNKIKPKFLTKEQAIILEEKERKEQLKMQKPKVKLMKKQKITNIKIQFIIR